MAPDVRVGLLQGVDEAQSGSLGIFGHVVRECTLDVLLGLLARDDGLGLHALLRARRAASPERRTRPRQPSKQASFTSVVDADDAPRPAACADAAGPGRG